jgi:hypothetical protein
MSEYTENTISLSLHQPQVPYIAKESRAGRKRKSQKRSKHNKQGGRKDRDVKRHSQVQFERLSVFQVWARSCLLLLLNIVFSSFFAPCACIPPNQCRFKMPQNDKPVKMDRNPWAAL